MKTIFLVLLNYFKLPFQTVGCMIYNNKQSDVSVCLVDIMYISCCLTNILAL